MKKKPTRETTMFDYYFPLAPTLLYWTGPNSLGITYADTAKFKKKLLS